MKLAVFHFNSLEFFPPVMNFIRSLPGNIGSDDQVVVFSTKPDNKEVFTISDKRIRIFRLAPFTVRIPAIKRYIAYFKYNLGALFYAVKFRPDVILYFESISAWVPYMLHAIFARKVPVFVHYHEYMSPKEYAEGMILNRFFHKLEKRVYPDYTQISHTNEYRMKLFRDDVGLEDSPKLKIRPNFPPKTWYETTGEVQKKEGVGIVYTGSLNFKDFFIEYLIDWVESQNGKVFFDIYTLHDDINLAGYLKDKGAKYTTFKGNVPYDRLPAILKAYQIGVILYNNPSENMIYNAPNKLFEYAACGLDVWFPGHMTGALPYKREDKYPRIIPIDFRKIMELEYNSLVSREGLPYEALEFNCESVNTDFIKSLSRAAEQSHIKQS